MIRKAMRKPAVMAALGITANSTFYSRIAAGAIPPGVKIDPNGRVVVWFEDEIEAIQRAAIDRAYSKSEAA